MVLYLKYRPQTLADIVGQEHIKKVLGNSFIQNRLAHAYLFCGPKGTGKTSTARILAKMVNCEASRQSSDNLKVEDSPCNKCDSCTSITNGSCLDLIEIDAASNRGIDDIRELREKIKLAPSSARKKVYIIDEAHMLTTEAFNALLKTLEEPPSHAMFILATTEEGKIPATISSRTQKLRFEHAREEQLIEVLEKVAKKEKIDAERDALELIARKSEGSFRDSIKILDAAADSGKKLTAASVGQIFKGGEFEKVEAILLSISRKDIKKALELLEADGGSPKEFTASMLDVLRSLLLIKYQAWQSEDTVYSKAILKLSEKFNEERIIRLINLFHEAVQKLKTTSIPSLPVEVAIVESCRLETGEQGLEIGGGKVEIGSLRGDKKDQAMEVQDVASNTAQISSDVVLDSDTVIKQHSSDMSKLLDKWTYILETIKPYNYSLEALLRQVKVIKCEGGTIILEVPYSFHQRILEAPKSRGLLESVLSDVLEKEVKVSCILGARPVRMEEIANVEVAADDEVIKLAAEIFNSEPVN